MTSRVDRKKRKGYGILALIALFLLSLAGTGEAATIAAGWYHTLASQTDGSVWAWGDNTHGQLGFDPIPVPNNPIPTQVPGLTGVIAVAGGAYHSLALKSDGTVWAWGLNSDGQLGVDPGTTAESATPAQVQGLTGIIAIAAESAFSLALKNDGTVWAWGNNGDGELARDTAATPSSSTPVQILGVTGITAIAAGGGHCLALASNGSVWGWGLNYDGQLGQDPSGGAYTITTPVEILTGMTAIAAGNNHSLAVKSDGTVWAWGRNDVGELGNGTTTPSWTPVQVQSVTNIVAVAAGYNHSLALKADGTVWGWGDNVSGGLGDGTIATRLSPVQALGLTGATAIAAGIRFSLALKDDGTVWTWGWNNAGQLGNGTTADQSAPGRSLNANAAAFVTRFYQECLGRAQDPGGLAYWANALMDHSLTGTDVAQGFVFSQEFVNLNTANDQFVTVLYHAFFNREPDPGGLNYWTWALANGSSRQDVLNGFLGSAEFVNLCATYHIWPSTAYPLVAQFVSRFYLECLGRTPDQSGLDYWTGTLLAHSMTGSDVAQGFIFSSEFLNLHVTDAQFLTVLYHAFFNREPDPDGLSYWLWVLGTGVSRPEVVNGFLSSGEFAALCAVYGITAI